MEIKNKLSLEKKSILTLNKVDMEVVQGGTWGGGLQSLRLSSQQCYKWSTLISGTLGYLDELLGLEDQIKDWLHDQSDTVEHRTSGQTSEALATYGGCMVSEVEVICS